MALHIGHGGKCIVIKAYASRKLLGRCGKPSHVPGVPVANPWPATPGEPLASLWLPLPGLPGVSAEPWLASS